MMPIGPINYNRFDCRDDVSSQPAKRVMFMLHEYIDAAMQRVVYEYLDEDGLFFCHVPELKGAWAAAESEGQSRAELAEVLEDWVQLGLSHGDHIPVLAGIDLNATHTV